MAKKAAVKTAKQKGTRFRTIRVTGDVYDQVHKVVEDVSLKGWSHVGVDRRDPPSITSVVAEAIARLVRVAR